jgi:hypothetical protein
MWLCMGIRYDLVYVTKELSRVLQEPTATALEILEQTLLYVSRTQKAYLQFNPDDIFGLNLLTQKTFMRLTNIYTLTP